MDQDKLIKRLMATFIDELDEHVHALSRDLLALEKEQSPERRAEHIKLLFRTAHSLKGAARAVNLTAIESGAHRMEMMLSAAREGRAALNAEGVELLLALTDKIADAGSRLRAGTPLTDSPLEKFLAQYQVSEVQTAAPPRPPPPSAPAPVVGETRGWKEPAPERKLGEMTVRVPAQKLDTLLAASGELLLARRALESGAEEIQTLQEFVRRWNAEWRRSEKQILSLSRGSENGDAQHQRVMDAVNKNKDNLLRLDKELEKFGAGMTQDLRPLDQAASRLDQEIYHIRMFPFSTACESLDRTARDLAKAAGKEVELAVEGGDVELDRSILEALKDPLTHLVRNAVDHGVETPDKRRAAGKAPQGRVRVSARLHGNRVEVAVSDDGSGLDLGAIRAQAARKRMPEPESERELANFIFLPGFSTARLITEVSGRGVGLDVVKSRAEALHGTAEVSFAPGLGTRFTLAVPLTLTTMQALVVGIGSQAFAFAVTHVVRLLRAGPEELKSIEGREIVSLDGKPIPVASLAESLGLRRTDTERGRGKALLAVINAGGSGNGSAGGANGQTMAFAVDELLVTQEIVIKTLGPRLPSVRHVSGATVLPTGQIALIINAAELIRAALRKPRQQSLAEGLATSRPVVRKRLLVADDSVTTRTLEKSILEAAGYDVMTAVDGADAWDLLQKFGADLVVSDVEMPRLDGFGLTEAIRRSKRFRELPVILLTALESERDRARGIDVGASGYLGKSAFDHTNLLETVAQLL